MKPLIFVFLLLQVLYVRAQQVPDSSFHYPIAQPRYALGKGPVVMLDEAHHNFHTLGGRYYAFGKLLSADGYNMVSGTALFTQNHLSQCRILVISNALHADNQTRGWSLPTPSAFSADEIAAVKAWVNNGGRLLLIADHMPFGGAAADLAAAFGFGFKNGFALDNRHRDIEVFYRSNGALQNTPITDGFDAGSRVDTIVTFTGQAFSIPRQARSVLALNDTYTILLPEVAWEFTDSTPWLSAKGLHQLAYRHFGKGKVFVSGEAAMFSSQLSGPQREPTGMSLPEARQNAQLLMNIMRWLDE